MVDRFLISHGWGADENVEAVWAKDYDAAQARIRELEAAIVDFWNYAKLVLPMPVHPAVGAIMRIGQELESQSDRSEDSTNHKGP